VKCAIQYIKRKDLFPQASFKITLDKVPISGDEVLSFFNITTLSHEKKIDLIASAVSFAFVLKVFWLASPYNLLRLSEKKFPRDISIGIHTGPAETITDDPDSDIAGLHINVTKRLETLGRSGSHSRILVSDDVAHSFSSWLGMKKSLPMRESPPILYTCFEPVKTPLDLKGIPVKVSPFELCMDVNNEKAHNLFRHIQDTPDRLDIRAERAASILSKTLFGSLDGIKSLRDIIGQLADPIKYIDTWFESINPIPRLFLNDLWTEMIVFFFSCGFIRYAGVSGEKKKKYIDITDTIYEKLMITFSQQRKQKKAD
jgi:hypothetical protein